MTRRPDDRRRAPAFLHVPTDEELMQAVRSAESPPELDLQVNERLIAAAFEDPVAPPTEEELRESAQLREALDGGKTTPDAELAAALAAATTPRTLAGDRLDELVGRALAAPKRRSNVIYVAFAAVATTAAVAAAALLVLVPADPRSTRPSTAFATSRTTTDLFRHKFRPGETTSRVDRIAASRERDLRSNRYLAWGLK